MSYDTQKLIKKIEDRRKPLPFFLQRYFPTLLEFITEEILFDQVFDDRRLAPFVSPVVEGKVMKSIGSTEKAFKPAYLKPKHTVQPSRAMKRRPGEQLNGSMSPQQRLKLILGELFMQQDEMIDNRLEWMAVQVMRAGAVIVVGEDYPRRVVDFGRDSGLDEALLTTARWDDSAPDPLTDLETKSQAMSLAQFGAPATDVIFSPTPWNLFQARDDVKAIINRDFRGNEGSSVMRGPVAEANTVQYVGKINTFNLFLDSRQYVDDAGVAQKYLPDGEVLLANPMIDGVQAFGAILDNDALVAARAWPKHWKKDDPSATVAMTQSAPLVIPSRQNACARLQVL